MKLLVKDVRAAAARELNCADDDPRVVEYINRAIELMSVSNDWANMKQILSVVAYNGYLTLPPSVVVPIKFNIGGRTGQPYGRHYQFAHTGPGLQENWNYAGNNLIDLGEFPTTYDIDPDHPQRIAIWSDKAEAFPCSITIRGLDENGKDVRSPEGKLGETITWVGDDDDTCTLEKEIQYTVSKFSQITQIVKEKSNGYVTLCTIDDDEKLDRVLSCFHPYETTPSYRRFQIYGASGADADGYTTIRGLFRICYTPVYVDEDPLIISLTNAVILGVKAIWLYDNDEYQKAAAVEGVIERMLTNQTEQYEVMDNMIDIDEGYGFGDVENL